MPESKRFLLMSFLNTQTISFHHFPCAHMRLSIKYWPCVRVSPTDSLSTPLIDWFIDWFVTAYYHVIHSFYAFCFSLCLVPRAWPVLLSYIFSTLDSFLPRSYVVLSSFLRTSIHSLVPLTSRWDTYMIQTVVHSLLYVRRVTHGTLLTIAKKRMERGSCLYCE